MARKKTKMLNDYQKAEDVNMRLNESVVFYKDQPVYVLANGMLVDLYKLRSDLPYLIGIKANDPDLDVRSPALGFVNTGAGVCWVVRLPQRKQKQGISVDNTCFAHLDKIQQHKVVGQALMCTVYFENMLLNKYPTYAEAMEKACDSAFHRHFAIQKQVKEGKPFNLFHLDRVVATFNGLGAWKIKPEEDNTVLRMYLNDLGVPIA